VDSEMFEKKLYPDSGAKLIGVLGSISPDGQIVLQDVEPWQQLIETRAKMMKEYYYHPVSARSSGALEQLLRLAIKGGYLTVDELKNSGDDRIRLRIQSLVREDRGAALLSGRQELAPYLSDYVDLFDVSLGFYDQRKWQQLKFSSKSELDNFLMTLEKEVSEKAIKVSPYDFTKKKITVTRKQQDGNLEEVKLKSKNTELDEDNTKFTLYIPQ
jgi:HD superfamily phosphohydrolase